MLRFVFFVSRQSQNFAFCLNIVLNTDLAHTKHMHHLWLCFRAAVDGFSGWVMAELVWCFTGTRSSSLSSWKRVCLLISASCERPITTDAKMTERESEEKWAWKTETVVPVLQYIIKMNALCLRCNLRKYYKNYIRLSEICSGQFQTLNLCLWRAEDEMKFVLLISTIFWKALSYQFLYFDGCKRMLFLEQYTVFFCSSCNVEILPYNLSCSVKIKKSNIEI